MKTKRFINLRFLLVAGLLLAGSSLSRLGAAAPDGGVPTVYSQHAEYLPQETIRIGWAGGPANALDWIGVYPQGVVPGSVASTLWLYVDGTQGGALGLSEGTVDFEGGLGLEGVYDVHLLENDGYTVLASSSFEVVGPNDPLVRSDKRFYAAAESIVITFELSLGGAKDWIGVYPVGVIPGDEGPSVWLYVDGTQAGNTPVVNGSVSFAQGLEVPGDYVAYLLANDGYDIQAREVFTVRSSASSGPRILRVSPASGTTISDPRIRFSATLTNGVTALDSATVGLALDGQTVTPVVVAGDNSFEITYEQTGLFASDSAHTFVLTYRDDAVPAGNYEQAVSFSVAGYRSITLPDPIVFEDFDSVPEGSLPAGWTEKNFTDITNPEEDLTNLDSATYARWTVIEASRCAGEFVTYSNPGSEASVYERVLTPNPLNVVNGEVLDGPLASGRFLFANSGYRNVSEPDLGQVLYVVTPDYDLSGEEDVHLSFHSLWEQNQDSLAAVEYSIDGGQTWFPILYCLVGSDVLMSTNPVSGELEVDAVATMTTEHADVARYYDDQFLIQGGSYGAFIGAAVSSDLAPHIEARADDDPVGSKRVELFRLPLADKQAAVRIRFAHVGTDSWYFGIDDFGLYSIPESSVQVGLQVERQGDNLVLSWPAEATGYILEQSAGLSDPLWTATPGVTGNTATVPLTQEAMFFRLRR